MPYHPALAAIATGAIAFVTYVRRAPQLVAQGPLRPRAPLKFSNAEAAARYSTDIRDADMAARIAESRSQAKSSHGSATAKAVELLVVRPW